MTLKNNLPPESQPWGRDIEKRLSDLEFGNGVALNRGSNTNDGVLATLRQLSTQLTTLSTQQTALTTAQTNITTLLSNQIVVANPQFHQGASYSLTTSPSAVARATATFITPAGYTQAVLWATSNDQAVNSTGSVGYLHAWLQLPGLLISSPSSSAPAGSMATATVTGISKSSGLTTGSPVTVTSVPFVESGTWASSASNYTNLVALCIFLK